MDWIDAAVAWFGEIISQNLPDGPIKAMLVDGVIGGVGAVIVFLPQILILYFFISSRSFVGYKFSTKFYIRQTVFA